jgi:thiosulfate reductase cytochrome b subunit
MTTSVYMYRGFERFWHWTQAILILLLATTGFEIHGAFEFFGYQQAVAYHNASAIAFLVLIAFAVFWHFTTGEWRQYVPTRQFLRAQIDYYITGIFNDAPHPTRKTAASKLNPLQKLVYLGLKVLVIPVMALSGLLYMFHRYPAAAPEALFGPRLLTVVAVLHTAGAFFLVAFVITHIYLTTTGETPVANLKAMLTGHEDPRTEPAPPGLAETARGEA